MSINLSIYQGLTTEICNGIKNRSLLRGKTSSRERGGISLSHSNTSNTRSISSARLLLCLLAAGCSRFESKVITSLCDALSEALLADNRAYNSLWFEASVWYTVVRVSSSQLRNAFEQLLSGCLLTEVSIGPLVTLAFALIDQTKASPSTTTKARLNWINLTSAVVLSSTRPPLTATTPGPSQEGVWLLTRLFELRDYSRSSIARYTILT